MSIKIGTLTLPHGLMLAPMAGVTDRSFRVLCRRFGAEYLVSEMVSAKALCYEQRGKKRSGAAGGTAILAAISREETPMAIQLFGSEPSFMAEAAKLLEEGAYRGCTSEAPPVAIDVNMGCPVRKITGNGEGSALMKNPQLAGEIVYAISRAVTIPVTVKIRAGWDEQSKNAPQLARILEQAGAKLICVHGRTREQQYAPGADWQIIAETKKSVSVPVVGNGDVGSAQDALRMLEQTGCDGVMVGRGAMGNPWIFSEIASVLEGRTWNPPSVTERLQTAEEHLEQILIHKGNRVGFAEAKRHVSYYLSGLRGAAVARGEIMRAHDPSQIRLVLRHMAETEQEEERQGGDAP